MPMKPLRTEVAGNQETLGCLHWRSFPPAQVFADEPIDALRAQKRVSDTDYQRFKTWEKVCGLTQMDKDKCLKCPFIRKLVIVPNQIPKLMSLDGKSWIPVVDIPTFESMNQGRDYVGAANRGLRSNPKRHG